MSVHKRRAHKRHAHGRRRHTKLTKRQLLQRKYAGKIRSLRARLAGKGRGVAKILKGASAQKLRRKYGLHNPYAKR